MLFIYLLEKNMIFYVSFQESTASLVSVKRDGVECYDEYYAWESEGIVVIIYIYQRRRNNRSWCREVSRDIKKDVLAIN